MLATREAAMTSGIWWEDGGFDSNNMEDFLYDLVEID